MNIFNKYFSSSFIFALAIFISVMFSSDAFAATGTSAIATVICQIVAWYEGPMGFAIAHACLIGFLLRALTVQFDIAGFIVMSAGIILMMNGKTIAAALGIDGC